MIKKGFFQALLVFIYCAVVGAFFVAAPGGFSNFNNPFIGLSLVLVLFSISVLFCGLAVFYQPYMLFFDKKRKQAANLVLYTTGWLFAFFTLALLAAVLLS